MKKVLVVMGSDSDLKVMEKCVDRLKSFDIPTEVRICSAHRTPAAAEQLAKNAAAEGFGVIIAAAGKAAHLGGVLAAYTTLPVIGVPMATSVMGGMDSLLSIVQMPKGIPVATVAIDGADNAAILAAQMIALSDDALAAEARAVQGRYGSGSYRKGRKGSRSVRVIYIGISDTASPQGKGIGAAPIGS